METLSAAEEWLTAEPQDREWVWKDLESFSEGHFAQMVFQGVGASSPFPSSAALNSPRTNRACGFLSLQLQNHAQLLHVPGCSW